MTLPDDYLQAIVAAPHDDLPRLILADWLDEEGDIHRAEFIRLQIDDTPGSRQRAEELLQRHRNEWGIPGLSGVQEFRRGFVEHVRTSAAAFLERQALIARQPVLGLRLPLAVDHLDALAQVPWLHRIEHLDLTATSAWARLWRVSFLKCNCRSWRVWSFATASYGRSM